MKKKPSKAHPDPFGDLSLDELFENAVRSNDPVFRERMALLALEHIKGASLPPQIVGWLRYVLGDLFSKGTIPTRSTGRPTDSFSRLKKESDLYLFLDRHADRPVNVALDRAARELGAWVHAFYKSPDFAVWRKILRTSRARK